MDKKTLILNSIIKEYIKANEPIGSEELKKSIGIDISSATIRNYFKKMMEEGSISQEHISSGRVPTSLALKEYWIERLKSIDDIYISNIESLQEKAYALNIFCAIKFLETNAFRHTENVLDCFLIVMFDQGQFVIDYNSRIESLLKTLIGMDIQELRKVCAKLGIMSICESIDFITKDQFRFINKKALLNMFDVNIPSQEALLFDILDNKNFEETTMGISFDKNFPKKVMRLKSDALIGGKNAQMICVGEIDKDYENFFSL